MRSLAALVLALVLAGCVSRGKLEQSGGTRVELGQKNYRVLKAGAIGEDWGWRLFCLLPFANPNYATAKSHLYRGVQVEGKATGLANLTEDRSGLCFLFFSLDKLTLSADVIEFTDQDTSPPRRPSN
jgi:hypothetical protein